MTDQSGQSIRYQIVPIRTQAADEELWNLLARSVGSPTPSKIAAVRRTYETETGRGLLGAAADDKCVGCLGYHFHDGTLEVTHIAVATQHERMGVGRALVEAASTTFPYCEILAETDNDAVGFYRSLDFETVLSPKRPNHSERWRCRREAAGGRRL
jgi:ribosomal protein S18 acetylase RimI-like enzyme